MPAAQSSFGTVQAVSDPPLEVEGVVRGICLVDAYVPGAGSHELPEELVFVFPVGGGSGGAPTVGREYDVAASVRNREQGLTGLLVVDQDADFFLAVEDEFVLVVRVSG